jgi:phosphoribosylglycinamide formyltransferase-1
MRVGVLASGFGSNLGALLERRVEVVAVGSDKADAFALQRARDAGVPTAVFPRADYPDRPARDAAMADWLAAQDVELVVLAGYMQLVSPGFLQRFPQRVINVHPALLPAFPGLDAVQQALDHGVKVFGVTVHYVDEGVDTGRIIAQRAVELPGATTADEVMAAIRPLEHELLSTVVLSIGSRGP